MRQRHKQSKSVCVFDRERKKERKKERKREREREREREHKKSERMSAHGSCVQRKEHHQEEQKQVLAPASTRQHRLPTFWKITFLCCNACSFLYVRYRVKNLHITFLCLFFPSLSICFFVNL
jgi:hypothetical protein